MEFDEYQLSALATERTPAIADDPRIVPLLGLAGEAGQLLSEYKKHLRDGASHQLFQERVAEELGDLLWYVAVTATKFELKLDEVAQRNLEKCRDRWGNESNSTLEALPLFDVSFPAHEQLPRKFEAHLTTVHEGDSIKLRAIVNGKQMGEDLTDNAHANDGYRFHDVFHLACAALLGWSPVTRRNLGLKRKSNAKTDEVEDGGRAIVTEEGISALVFTYATQHAMLQGITSIDGNLLKTIRRMTSHLEVSVCALHDWEHTILKGYEVWRDVEAQGGGVVLCDLDERAISLKQSKPYDGGS